MSVNGWWRNQRSPESSLPSNDGPRVSRDRLQGDGRPKTTSRQVYSTGKFARIDPNMPFLLGEHIDGISLEEDFEVVKALRVRLGRFNHGPFDFFPVNWPVASDSRVIKQLEKEPFVVAPKPNGVRFLLYVDSEGKMMMENMAQHFFKVDQDYAPQITATETVLDGILTRKIIRDGSPDVNSNQEEKGKLTFVIMDATRCRGIDLTKMNILERISAVKDVIEPRLKGIQNGNIRTEKEVFHLDVTKYEDPSEVMEEYLSKEFLDRYDYSFHSFTFYFLKGGYLCGSRRSPTIFHWKESYIQMFIFRLKISDERGSTGDLYVGPGKGPNREEVKYGTIDLTDELRSMNGSIIECHYVDHHWIFVRKRIDRNHPHSISTTKSLFFAMENPVTRENLLESIEAGRTED